MKKLLLLFLLTGCYKDAEKEIVPTYIPSNYPEIEFSVCDSGIVMEKNGERLLLKLSDDQIHLRLPFHMEPQMIILFNVQPKN